MSKREAHVRTAADGAEGPATLTSAAEEHAQALRRQLLKSTEQAAKQLVGQTRAEGERRIEVAGRRAQAIAATVSQIEEAERALTERANAFATASKSLRAELEAFAAVLSDGEERLAPPEIAEEPELRLVASPAPKRTRPQPPPAPIGQFPFTGGVEEADGELEEGEAEEPYDEDDEDDEDQADEDDEDEELGLDEEDGVEEADEEDPPTAAEIARFFREHEEAESERTPRREEVPAHATFRERVRSLFTFPDAEEREDEVDEVQPPRRAQPAKEKAPRSAARNRLYTDMAGAVIGLSGAAALINYVLID
jgi:hypothetical protein